MLEDTALLFAFCTQWSRAEGGGWWTLCWEQVPGGREGQGLAGRLGQVAGHTHGVSGRGPGSTRKVLSLAGQEAQGDPGKREKDAAPATANPGMEQPEGILHSSASFGLRRTFEDSPHFKGLTCSF